MSEERRLRVDLRIVGHLVLELRRREGAWGVVLWESAGKGLYDRGFLVW